jgi:hypothetical protein
MTTQARQALRPCCLKNVSVAGMPRYPTLNYQWAIQKRARMKRSKEAPTALPGGGSISCSIFPSCGWRGVFAGAVLLAGALAMIGKLGRGATRLRPLGAGLVCHLAEQHAAPLPYSPGQLHNLMVTVHPR